MKILIDKVTLEKLYFSDKLSIRQIGKQLGLTKGQVDHLFDSYNITTRSYDEAREVIEEKRTEEKHNHAIAIIQERTSKGPIPRQKFHPIIRSNIVIPFPLTSNRDATVTVVLSDLHLGDANHLSDTYWSTIANTVEVLKNISGLYKIKRLYMVLNGDIVSGRDVFRSQELRNLIQRGHWQVFLGEIILKDTIKKFKEIKDIDEIVFVRGTHETLASNFILFIKRTMIEKTKYLSHGGVFNIAGDIGVYNILFTHGYGYSDVFPFSTGMMRDVFKTVNDYKNNGIQIDRICTGHTHWLSSGLVVEDFYWDVTGGFQKWEYTLSQRPAGAIIYLFNNNEGVCIPVRPDPRVENTEQHDVGLEYKNLVYYGSYLLKHLKEIEEINPDE